MGKLNFDEVLDTLSEYGISLTSEALDDISFYFCDNDYSEHYRDFELFEQSDGLFLVSIAGVWHSTKEVLH